METTFLSWFLFNVLISFIRVIFPMNQLHLKYGQTDFDQASGSWGKNVEITRRLIFYLERLIIVRDWILNLVNLRPAQYHFLQILSWSAENAKCLDWKAWKTFAACWFENLNFQFEQPCLKKSSKQSRFTLCSQQSSPVKVSDHYPRLLQVLPQSEKIEKLKIEKCSLCMPGSSNIDQRLLAHLTSPSLAHFSALCGTSADSLHRDQIPSLQIEKSSSAKYGIPICMEWLLGFLDISHCNSLHFINGAPCRCWIIEAP